MREMSLEVNGRALEVAIGPEMGPPLLLLHGVTRGWQDFVPILPALQTRWQVIGLTFRGHGKSSRTPGRYRLNDYVEDAVTVLTERCKAPAVVLGHSLGALTAVGLAARHPDRVRALILEDPPSHKLMPHIRSTPFYTLFAGLQALAGKGGSITEIARQVGKIELPQPHGKIRLDEIRDATSLLYTARCLKELDPEVLTPLLDNTLLDVSTWLEQVRRVSCPTLLLHGELERGGMLGRTDAEEMAKEMRDAMTIPLPNVGHLLHWLATEEMTRYVLGFLESLRI